MSKYKLYQNTIYWIYVYEYYYDYVYDSSYEYDYNYYIIKIVFQTAILVIP